jgi:hypothetical protein
MYAWLALLPSLALFCRVLEGPVQRLRIQRGRRAAAVMILIIIAPLAALSENSAWPCVLEFRPFRYIGTIRCRSTVALTAMMIVSAGWVGWSGDTWPSGLLRNVTIVMRRRSCSRR